jgi:ADP-ribose pyrophosphatase
MDYLDLLNSNIGSFEEKENNPIKIITNTKIVDDWQKKKLAELSASGKPGEWAEIGVVLDDPYIIVIRDLVEFPNGDLRGYFRLYNRADLNGGQGVVILCEMNQKFLLLHQFRHPLRSWCFEIPRGFGEPGVKARDQAVNEIREEVEGEIAELHDLGIYFNNTGLEGNKVQLFYAKLKSTGRFSIDEGIDKIVWVSLSELERMIASSEITDGFTIAAYTRAKLNHLI